MWFSSLFLRSFGLLSRAQQQLVLEELTEGLYYLRRKLEIYADTRVRIFFTHLMHARAGFHLTLQLSYQVRVSF